MLSLVRPSPTLSMYRQGVLRFSGLVKLLVSEVGMEKWRDCRVARIWLVFGLGGQTGRQERAIGVSLGKNRY